MAADAQTAVDPSGADIDGRLALIERDLNSLDTLIGAQRRLVANAAAAVAGARVESAAGSQAELEQSRLGKLDGQLSDVRARLDEVAGELAVAAATGGDFGSRLRRTGMLIVRTSALAPPPPQARR